MLKKIELENFSAFEALDLKCSPGVNVLIGENGTGKTHLMKVAYASVRSFKDGPDKSASRSKSWVGRECAAKLSRVFRPKYIGNLVNNTPGSNRCTVKIKFDDKTKDLYFSFGRAHTAKVAIHYFPMEWTKESVVFIPSADILSIYYGFASMYDSFYLGYDETWFDTCLALGMPALRGSSLNEKKIFLESIEDAMGGKIVCERDGRFYFEKNRDKMDITLLSEGLRKVGMLYALINNGSVGSGGCLFWDDPVASIHPKTIKVVASVLLALARDGVQIFLSTHSYAMLKEFDLQSDERDNVAFHNLSRNEAGSIECATTNNYRDIMGNAIDEAYGDLVSRVIQQPLNGVYNAK